jgi:hypothetical protein
MAFFSRDMLLLSVERDGRKEKNHWEEEAKYTASKKLTANPMKR